MPPKASVVATAKTSVVPTAKMSVVPTAKTSAVTTAKKSVVVTAKSSATSKKSVVSTAKSKSKTITAKDAEKDSADEVDDHEWPWLETLAKCLPCLVDRYSPDFVVPNEVWVKPPEYFEPMKFKVRSNPLLKHPRTQNKKFKSTALEREYFMIEALKERRLSIDISLGNGMGVRLRVRDQGYHNLNYICSRASKKFYGHKLLDNYLRRELVRYILTNWDKYKFAVKAAYEGQVSNLMNYEPDSPTPKVHWDAKFIYNAIHFDRFYDIKLFEAQALCAMLELNCNVIINSLDGVYHSFRPSTNFANHMYILATELRIFESESIDHKMVWLEFIDTPITKPSDRFLPNCTLYLTYENASINYFHLLEYENYPKMVTRSLIKDCRFSKTFPKMPRRLKPGKPKPRIDKETGKKRVRSGHVWFARTKRMMIYWRPKRTGCRIAARNWVRRQKRKVAAKYVEWFPVPPDPRELRRQRRLKDLRDEYDANAGQVPPSRVSLHPHMIANTPRLSTKPPERSLPSPNPASGTQPDSQRPSSPKPARFSDPAAAGAPAKPKSVGIDETAKAQARKSTVTITAAAAARRKSVVLGSTENAAAIARRKSVVTTSTDPAAAATATSKRKSVVMATSTEPTSAAAATTARRKSDTPLVFDARPKSVAASVAPPGGVLSSPPKVVTIATPPPPSATPSVKKPPEDPSPGPKPPEK